MRARMILSSLVVLFVAAVVCLAATDVQMGTWKLNEAKSKFSAGAPKNTMVVYAMMGDNIKVTVDGMDADGKPSHNEWTGKFDGKDYAVTGDPTADMRSYKQVNDHTLDFTNKKGGKTTMTGRITVSADGKTRTVTITGTDAKGVEVTSSSVFDKQ
jgi:hypothetical protein